MHHYSKFSLVIFLLLSVQIAQGQEPSAIVFEDNNGFLRYVMDANDNRIVDFSYAGYKQGEAEIPFVEAVASISPIEGDNTTYVQQVLDSISTLLPDENGIRGALLLRAGTYEINGTIEINASGVVLRGVGDSTDAANNTILVGVGNTPVERTIIRAGGLEMADWTERIDNSTSLITSTFLPAGSRTLEVASPENYAEGDEVIIFHPGTDAWLASINYGGTAADGPWKENEIDIIYKRRINQVNLVSKKVTLDVPIYDHFENALSSAIIFKLAETDIKTNIGIENLRIDISTNGELTEDHAKTAIELKGVEDCWVSDVTGLHFTYAMVNTTVASRVTVRSCKALEPHSIITGARRYNFAVSRKSSDILFTNCVASNGRHSFVSNGISSANGIVWHNSKSTGDYTSSEGHRRWGQALLFDNITFTNPNTNRLIGLYNRGDYGTGHGWSSVHSVAWNIKMPNSQQAVIQRPPQRQNYAIGCQGNVNGAGPFSHPAGYIEASGSEPMITSLYETQLANRLEDGPPIDAPARFLVEDIDDEIHISWLDIADNESKYVIEISYDGFSFDTLVELAADITGYQIPASQLERDSVYLRMFADAPSACPSAYTHSAYLDLSPPSSTVGLEKNSLEVSPNPVVDILKFKVGKGSISNVQVISVSGKYIPSEISSNEMNLSGLTPGTYFIRIELNSGESFVKRFLKI